VPYGVIRADRLRLIRKPVELTLGAYGFPDNGMQVTRRSEGSAQAIILKGRDATGAEKQLAMTIYDGWESLELVESAGTNPDSEHSVVVYAKTSRLQHNRYEPSMLISQVITKESWEDFRDDELFAIDKIIYTDAQGYGGYGPVSILLKDGMRRSIDFDGIEGRLTL